ncbi:PREDICTED: pentatricopeptide repeat-containing protein At1g80880, mitochondrial-like [Camelina sativa]|uniref:Pentatricopeptide repeat-containing protein At1g80880, mitochondrial-like n=1 Tax=Camelina sativa TaxID=90675 RepID=A0ABM0SXR0_CAMSA|nr:PREDICTED: pentatricopeptide repeat-containing protein At1g80880, mitochondrial-like [Camelina sativa]
MAAIVAIAQQLTRTQQWRIVKCQSLLRALSTSSSSSSFQNHSFSSAFHRTGLVHSQIFTQNVPRFVSSNRFFSTQIISDFLEINRALAPLEKGLIDLIRQVSELESEAEAMASLEDSSFHLNHESFYSLIWELRDEWRLAFLAFKWGEKRGCDDQKACDLMIWVLGNHQKFNIAWCLVRDMFNVSRDTRKAMFLMMDRYAAANDTSQAIRTFDIMDKFKHIPDDEAFQGLLYVLCRHGHIEKAEEFMLASKKLFPVDVEGFNIILNGWCNVWTDVTEAKRVWREMGNYCVTPNSDSYSHMISCFSKVGNLFDSLRLYDEMKKRGLAPGVDVYNSLVYVMTRENCFDEAMKLLDKMNEEGLKPDSVTYNSMIRPLCEAGKLDVARNVLATMISENLSLTVDTFHAFLEAVDFDKTLEVLGQMKISGLGPTEETFLLILGNMFKEKQPEHALKILAEMDRFEIMANPALYLATIQGLLTCGWLEKAREIYSEMKSKGFPGNPKLQKLLEEQKVKGIRKSKRIDLRRVGSRVSIYKKESDRGKT